MDVCTETPYGGQPLGPAGAGVRRRDAGERSGGALEPVGTATRACPVPHAPGRLSP